MAGLTEAQQARMKALYSQRYCYSYLCILVVWAFINDKSLLTTSSISPSPISLSLIPPSINPPSSRMNDRQRTLFISNVSDPLHFGADPCLWRMDPYPTIFVICLQDASKISNFLTQFFCLSLFEGKFRLFSRAESGSILLTSGSGLGRPKNTWIRCIRIRIRNTFYLFIV